MADWTSWLLSAAVGCVWYFDWSILLQFVEDIRDKYRYEVNNKQ